MATIEERLTAIEHEHGNLKHDNEELKQKIELHTIAIGALVNKATLESLNEKNDKIFQALIAHDEFTNRQLAEFRTKVEIQIEGKITGLQTEMRQGFKAVNARVEQQNNKIADLQTGMHQGFEAVNARVEQQDNKIADLQAEMRQGFKAVNARVEQQDNTITGLQTEMHQGFEAVNARFEAVDSRFDVQGKQLDTLSKQVEAQGKQLEQILFVLNTLTNKPE